MTDMRQVRQLRLRAGDRDELATGQLLLEDALRTASLPGLPVGGLTLVRRLDLGAFHLGNNAAALSRQIDQHITSLQPKLICPGAEERPEAAAVCFADPVEPYALYARLLARGERPSAWYWPLALPGLGKGAVPEPSLADLIRCATRSEFAPLAVCAIVDSVVCSGAVERLVEGLSTTEADAILDRVGSVPELSAAADSPVDHTSFAIEAPWQQVLLEWVPRLGMRDGRARLLALSAAIRKDRLNAPALAGRLLGAAAAGHSPAAAATVDDPRNRGGRARDLVRDAGGPATAGVPPAERGGEGPATGSMEREYRYDSPETVFPGGRVTRFAGLLFLVNALQRLEMEETLVRHPELSALDLPTRVLRACAARLGIPPGDVTGDVLNAIDELRGSTGPCSLVVPAFWLDLLLAPHRSRTLRLHRPGSGVRVLSDSSGALVLAVWRGATPMAVRELCRGRRLLRGKRLFAGDELQWIIRGHLFALGRFSRRLARMGLHSVAFRQGRIAVTRTHVDVTLDWADLDLRIRRAGLDVDPGWVPWLGRVLQFHYTENRSGDAEAERPGLPRCI